MMCFFLFAVDCSTLDPVYYQLKMDQFQFYFFFANFFVIVSL